MIDVLYSKAYKINVILIIMLKSKVLCGVVGAFPVSSIDMPSIHEFTEYFIEHNVTETEAAKSFRLHADDLLNKNLPPYCSRTPCNSTTKKYCLGNEMLHDHCCCDFRHGKEQFPWLPHSCYVGKPCKALIGSCYVYSEIRECCCDRDIAKQWKSILSSSTRSAVQLSLHLVVVILVLITL